MESPCWKCGDDGTYCWTCGERDVACECSEEDKNLGDCGECGPDHVQVSDRFAAEVQDAYDWLLHKIVRRRP